MNVEDFFKKEGIDIGDIVCYATPEGTKPPKYFCPMEMAEKYHKHKLKLLDLHIVSNNEVAVCPECGYPTFKRTFDSKLYCHGCDWIGQTDC